eukprot:TRINITY_DN1287_c0_g1_i1.p1 TRINITY_DN1287_c0_g1~~TRINITY_DN1287_c0_g1_i1.p1  ORF type:complete len:611 (+),score=158.79 TRINITY_DN1287_c0_g1_i1:137-1969(+)
MGQGAATRIDEHFFIQKVKLGQGSFGVVWRAVDKRPGCNGNVVAIKQLDKALLPRRGVKREDIEREITVMKAVDHENVTQLLDHFEDAKAIYLALEYCEGGDFGDKVKERGMAVQEPEVADWVGQICASIHALHAKGICHRDIKPDNFMVHCGVLKLSDFGLALYVPKGKLLTEKCGTPAFMAPEQHKLPRESRGYSHSCDMWAAGIAMYMCMFGGRHPFLTSNGGLDEYSLHQGRLLFHATVSMFGFGMDDPRFSPAAKTFCQRLVEVRPDHRSTVDQALRDDWLSQVRQSRPAVKKAAEAPANARVSQEAVRGPATPQRAGGRERSNSIDLPPEILQIGDGIQRGLSYLFSDFSEATAKTPSADPANAKRQQQEDEQLRQYAAARFGGGYGTEKVENRQLPEAAVDVFPDVPCESVAATPSRMTGKQGQASASASTTGASQAPQDGWKSEQPGKTEMGDGGDQGVSRSHVDSPKKAFATCHFRAEEDDEDIPEGCLKAGTKCRYYSHSWSNWIVVTVKVYNEKDGTYDLDARPHANLSNIAPIESATLEEAWPPGTIVRYESSTAGSWLDAVIVSFNVRVGDKEGTYNLDIRDKASVDRIRARKPTGI